PRLVIVDEAAMAPDDLHIALSPMLAVGGGRLVLLSTPLGMRGFFYEQWAGDDPSWERIKVTAAQCPRIAPAFLEGERQRLGERWFRQEYECSFEQSVDQVFSTGSILDAFSSDEEPLFGAA